MRTRRGQLELAASRLQHRRQSPTSSPPRSPQRTLSTLTSRHRLAARGVFSSSYANDIDLSLRGRSDLPRAFCRDLRSRRARLQYHHDDDPLRATRIQQRAAALIPNMAGQLCQQHVVNTSNMLLRYSRVSAIDVSQPLSDAHPPLVKAEAPICRRPDNMV